MVENKGEDVALISTKNGGNDESGSKKTSLMSTILMLAGSIIGTGIFMTPNSVVNSLPSIFYSLLIWIVCGILSLMAGLCYSELGCLYNDAGGEYVYFTHAYHDSVAFSFLFTNFLFIKPITIAILVLFFVEISISVFVTSVETVPTWIVRLVCAIFTMGLCILNCSSNKLSVGVNSMLTYLKFICMGIIICLSIYKLSRGEFDNIKDLGLRIPLSASALSTAIYNGMWAYDGFNQLAYMVEEMEKPEKNLLLASVIGLGIVIGFYLVLNFSYLVLLGVKGVSETNNVSKAAVLPYMHRFSAIVTVLVALSAFGTANATAYCGVKIYSSAASRGHLPRLIAATHKSQETFIPALIIQALLTVFFLVVSPDIRMLLLYFSGASWVFYGLAFISVIVLRFRKPDEKRIFKVWIIVPYLLGAISIAIIVLGFIDDWAASLTSVSLILGSVPVYFFFIRKEGFFTKCKYEWLENLTNKILKSCGLEIVEGGLN